MLPGNEAVDGDAAVVLHQNTVTFASDGHVDLALACVHTCAYI